MKWRRGEGIHILNDFAPPPFMVNCIMFLIDVLRKRDFNLNYNSLTVQLFYQKSLTLKEKYEKENCQTGVPHFLYLDQIWSLMSHTSFI